MDEKEKEKLKQKHCKQNLNFFTKWSGLTTIGVGVALAGVIMYLLRFALYSWIWSVLPYPMIIGGIILYAVAASGRTSENNYRAMLENRVKALEDIQLDEKMLNNHGRTVEVPEKRIYSDYIYGREGTLYKLLKDDTIASNRYCVLKIYFLQAGLYVVTYDFSLTEDDEKRTERLVDYKDIKSVTAEREEIEIKLKKTTKKQKLCYVSVNIENGEKIRFIQPDDAFLEEFMYSFMRSCHNMMGK